MTKRCLQNVGLALLLASSLALPASAQSRGGAPSAGPKAGSITALLPTAKIARGTGRAQTILEAKKGDEVVYNDLIKTEKGGRARITLNDQSILSLGSQAELRIVRHDARTQQTALQLGYGKMRAEVASITRDGGRFELRTPTAVAGVIGTDFGTDSSLPGVTNFLCISGIVSIGSSAREAQTALVQCPAGSFVKVESGLPPTQPRPLTKQEIQGLIQDTEPAVISALSPASGMPGTELKVDISGSKLTGIKNVEVATVGGSSGAGAARGTGPTGPMVNGVTAAIEGEPADTKAQMGVSISKDASPGVRTITFTKANGQSATAVFTVLAPPGRNTAFDLAAVKKAYFEVMEDERLAAIAAVNAVGIAVQQQAGDAEQTIEALNDQLNPKLNLGRLQRELYLESVTPLLNVMTAAGGSINTETGRIGGRFSTSLDTAAAQWDAQRLTSEQRYEEAQKLFNRANQELLDKYEEIQKGLVDPAATASKRVVAVLDAWMEQIKEASTRQQAPPIVAVNTDDRSVDLGAATTLDAGRSKAMPGASIVSYNWVLCDPSYNPQQVGVPISPKDAQCRPIGKYSATNPEFKLETCRLNPVNYIARLTVVDSNNQSSAMDVRVRVLPPQYEPPIMRLRSLTDTYQQLQPNRFLGFFDEGYSGLTELQESIRRTFAALASMSINLRPSQEAIDCNEATVRADWDQNYTFKDDQTCASQPLGTVCQRVVFKQQEQLTVRMRRVPGKNWFITEFQGDNGTVQGTPPGPIQRDLSLPDLVITSITPVSLPAAGRENSISGIAPGANGFAAVVQNIGRADLQGTVRVRFEVRDGNGNSLASDIRDLQGPLAVGASATVIGQMDIPDLGPGVGARIFAGVNPGCQVVEQNCDASNITLLDIIIGTVDLQVTGFSPVGPVVGTQPGQLSVQVKNLGSRTSLATTGNLRLFFGTTPAGNGDLPAIAPGATANVPLNFTAPNVSGSQNVLLAIAPSSTGEFNPANDNLSGTLNVTAAVVDLKASALTITSAAPYLSGQTVNVTLSMQNTGNRPSALADQLACRLTGTAGTQTFTPVALPQIAAGATLTGLTYSFVLPPNFAGADTLTCGASQDPFEAAAAIADNTVSVPMTVGLNVDLQLVNLPTPTGIEQMGAASSVPFGVKNFGLDTAPSGWNAIVRINGSQLASFVATAPLASLATLPITLNYTVPQIAPAPADITNVPASLEVNTNAAIAETNTGNNVFNAALRLVDFTLTVVPASPLTAVSGRSFVATALQVLPVSYPLPITLNYTGLPSGISAVAFPSLNISGSPVSPGSFSVTAQGTADGVTHNASGSIAINVLNEITITPGASVNLIPAAGGGPPQNVTIAVAGGIYPLTLSFIQPTGITITGPTTLAAPGNVTYQLSAGLLAATGTQTFQFKAQDSGSSPTTPGNLVQIAQPYSVNAFVDLQVQPYTFTTTGPYLAGQTVGLQLNLRNIGNAASNAADTYSCTVSGTGGTFTVASGTVPSIPGLNGTTTINAPFVLPAGMFPTASITCTVSQDPLEAAANIGDNMLATSITANRNVNLTIQNVSALAPAQMGSAQMVSFDVVNNGLDTAPAGWLAVMRINGGIVATQNVPATLAAGGTLSMTLNFTVPQVAPAPADVTGITGSITVNDNNAFTETTLADNVFSDSTMRLVDFAIQRNFATVQGVVGRAFNLAGAVTILPNTYPFAVSVNYTGLPAGLSGSGTGNVDVSGTLSSPGSSTVNASATVSSVTRNMASAMIIDSFDEITMSLGTAFSLTGGGSAQPFQVNVTGGIYPVTLDLNLPAGVSLAGGATDPFVLTAPGSVTWQLQADPSVSGGTSLTDIVVHATDPGSAAVAAGNVNFAPPYDRTAASYDLEILSVTGSSANFSGRDFNTYPLLTGESGDFTVSIRNNGPAPSPAGLHVGADLFSEINVTPTPTILGVIPSGSTVNVNVHVRQSQILGGSTNMDFTVFADAGDSNLGNNSLGVPVTLSDWDLSVAGLGVQGDELSITVPSPATASTNLQLTLSIGSTFVPIELSQGAVASYMTAVVPANIDTSSNPSVQINASTTPVTPPGFYSVQVIAKMKDGATVTAQRATIIHIVVNGGTPLDTVSLAANPNNESDGNLTGCSTPCAPVQIDGLLVETVQLTPTRSGGSSGSTDLVFSDLGSTVVSNVTASGAPLVQQLTALPYGTPMNVNFGAEEQSGGSITSGLTATVVSATAVSTAQRGAPPLDTVGSQQFTLHFNIGDINVSQGCIAVGPGQNTSVTLSWSAVDGFSKTLSLAWTSTAGANIDISGPTTLSAPYNNTVYNFTSNETTEGAFVQFVLAATISNANGSATKFFPVFVSLQTNGCASAGRGGTAAARDSIDTTRPYWKRGSSGSLSSASRSTVQVTKTASGTPDLQLKPVDVSLSPSIPKPGDALSVRFKVTNAGDGMATDVPVALQVNGTTVATDTYTLKPGASTLGGFQYQLPAVDDSDRDRPIGVRPVRYVKNADGPATLEEVSEKSGRLPAIRKQLAGGAVVAQLVVDPAGTTRQKSSAYKTVALTKAGFAPPVDGAPLSAAERVYLEMNTICSGFRVTSGAVVDCESGGDLDIAIEDFKTSRFTLTASIGIADLGVVDPNRASADGAQFSPHASLVLGHTYAVQMTGGKVGFVKFAASLTPRQLEAEAKRRFGLNGVRILKKLGADTGTTGVGDVSGRISADALMYFDMTFRP